MTNPPMPDQDDTADLNVLGESGLSPSPTSVPLKGDRRGGQHLPTMPDPTLPQPGQELPPEDPAHRPVPIDDPRPRNNDANDDPDVERVA